MNNIDLGLAEADVSPPRHRMQSQEARTVAGLPNRQAVLAAAATLLVAYSNCSLIGMEAGRAFVPAVCRLVRQLLHSLRGVGEG